MANDTIEKYARSLLRLHGPALDRLAGELGTGRYDRERDDELRIRLREGLPPDIDFGLDWTPVIPVYQPQPAKKRIPTIWEELMDS